MLRTLILASLIPASLLASVGCLRQTTFHCDNNTDCGATGVCEAQGLCSFPDSTCTGSQQRFGDSAGSLANQCVGGDNPMVDASPMIDAPPLIDGDIDAPGGCPNGYNALAGANHLYKLLPSATWTANEAGCRATSPTSAYLAIPDDAAELAAFATLAVAGKFAIGITDSATENVFLTVKGGVPPILPWGPGEPDDTMGGQDCVVGISATQIATEKCSSQFVAVCECEP
jgi:hypothetical protein